MKHLVLAFAALLMLNACGPVHETVYQMVPPPTDMGRMCANNCLLASSNCQQHCEITGRQCEQMEDMRADQEYRDYKRERRAKGKEVKKSRSSFDNSYRCDSDDCMANCVNTHHLCHTNCGGQIIPTTRCTAFCN